MKVYVNDRYIKRRASIGKWASLLGLAVLAGGFVLSLRDPRFFIVSFATLILGFLLSNVGIYYANRYARPDRPDAVLAQTLKGFDKRYALYQFILPVSHVLREPGGLTIFTLKPQEGEIAFEDGKWRHRQGWGRLLRWVGQEGLGKPDREVDLDIQTMQDWLQKQGDDQEVPVRGVVVFTSPKASLQLDNPPVDAVSAKQLTGWLRKIGRLPPLSKEDQGRLAELLDQEVPGGESEADE